MGLKIRVSVPYKYEVRDGNRLVASLHLDSVLRLESLVLWPDATLKEQEACARLALSYAMQYRHKRENKLPIGKFAPLKTEGKPNSKELLSFERIPEVVKNAPLIEVLGGLQEWNIERVHAKHSLKYVLAEALKDKRLPEMNFRILPNNDSAVEVHVQGPAAFTFWKAVVSHDYPASHPEAKRHKPLLYITGTSSYVAGSKIIERIYPPPQVGSWLTPKTDCFVKGQTLRVVFYKQQVLAEDGKEKVVELLLALLGKSNSYVAVSDFGTGKK